MQNQKESRENNMEEYIQIPEIGYHKNIDWSSERVQLIGEQFQYLGPYSPVSDYIKIADSFKINIVPITVIFGASGSGKSSVLRGIYKELGGFFLSEMKVPNDYLINIIGVNIQEAISILSSVGLGQGHLFLCKYNELSDGQKFRLRLALMLSKGEKTVYVDEFGAGLDVTTAKNLAITLAKYIRRNKIHAFICCNNFDVVEALSPDRIIKMDYGCEMTIMNKEDIVVRPKNNIKLEVGNFSDYLKLKKYHYLQDDVRMDDAKILVAKVNEEIVGVQVCTSALSKRREKLHPFLKKVNECVLTGQRTIVHPEYNNCGIGKLLVTNAARIFNYPVFELRSALFRYVPMPLNWGLKEYISPYYDNRRHHDELENYIKQLGFSSYFFISENYTKQFIHASDKEKLCNLIEEASNERHIFLLNYFIYIMKESGIEIPENTDEIFDSLISTDKFENDDDSMIKELFKHSDPRYRSFYYFN